jgi:peptidoglycan/LPS O-acetylase OafA/YrhL
VHLQWIAYAALLLFLFLAIEVEQEDPILRAGGYSLLALMLAGLTMHVATSTSDALATVLSWPVLVSLGRVSYGLYLWHWPVFVIVASLGMDAVWPLKLGLAYLVAWASYRYLETRFTSKRRRLPFADSPPREIKHDHPSTAQEPRLS